MVTKESIQGAFLRELQSPRANFVIDALIHQGYDSVDIVNAMWELVDEGAITYGADARLTILENNDQD